MAQAATLQAVSDLCGDLGYRPSDLIQANAVIWVEGPSDRIYLRHWLDMVAPGEFIEGIHYSVMFYGGGLLRHLTADDPTVEEFISLRRLNRHSAILIDSDKTSPAKRLTDAKVRIQAEFDREDMPGLAWITACRTIENYVPEPTLTAAVESVHKRSVYQPPADKWADPLYLTSSRPRRRSGRTSAAPADDTTGSETETGRTAADKVKVARKACELWPADELPLDLRARMKQVVEFIRTANGSQAPLPAQPAT